MHMHTTIVRKSEGESESDYFIACWLLISAAKRTLIISYKLNPIMAKFHDFLVEHAKFPFPLPDEFRTTVTTDVSDFEVGLLKREWKAKYAVRDDTLVRKLCDSLQNILGDIALSADSEKDLLANFSPRLEFDEYGEDEEWLTNASKVQASFQKVLCNPDHEANPCHRVGRY
jgi:hypothetical protein